MSIQPELDRARRREPRREQHVVAPVERGHLAAEAMGGLGGPDVVRRRDLLAPRRRVERDVLHLAAARRAARGRMSCATFTAGVGGGERQEGRDHRVAVDVGIRLVDVVAEVGAERAPISRTQRRHAGSTGAPLGVRSVHAMRSRPAARAHLGEERPGRRRARRTGRPAPGPRSRRAARRSRGRSGSRRARWRARPAPRR